MDAVKQDSPLASSSINSLLPHFNHGQSSPVIEDSISYKCSSSITYYEIISNFADKDIDLCFQLSTCLICFSLPNILAAVAELHIPLEDACVMFASEYYCRFAVAFPSIHQSVISIVKDSLVVNSTRPLTNCNSTQHLSTLRLIHTVLYQ